jgi:hypothetical protein
MRKLILLLLIIPLESFGQSWSYNSGGNKFDGNYRMAYANVSGGEFPYNEPSLIITKYENSGIKFYLNNSGYYQYDTDLSIEFVFDGSDKIYEIDNFSLSNDGSAIFFNTMVSYDKAFVVDKSFNLFQILDLFTKKNTVYIRVSDRYNTTDLKLSLSGSTRAINYVFPSLNSFLSDIENSKLEEENTLVKAIARNKALIEKYRSTISDNSIIELEKILLDKEKVSFFKYLSKDLESDSIYFKTYDGSFDFIKNKQAMMYFISSNGDKELIKRVVLKDEYFEIDNYSTQEIIFRDNLIKYKISEDDVNLIILYFRFEKMNVDSIFLSKDGVSDTEYNLGYIKVGGLLADNTPFIIPKTFKKIK